MWVLENELEYNSFRCRFHEMSVERFVIILTAFCLDGVLKTVVK